MTSIEIKDRSILFLLGAGCSKEADIPMSYEMVKQVEELIENEEESEWYQYRDLYYYLKSSIQYSEGIFGNFNEPFNIEKLLIVIGEIEKRDKNLVYPFIGTWNVRLMDLAGQQFKNITEFKSLVIRKLNDWVTIDNYNVAKYYEGFSKFHKEVGILQRVFTLNYDLCFEKIVKKKSLIADGFDPESYEWHYSNFEETGQDFCLYKLHGSIDWKTDKSNGNKLYKSDHLQEKPELIFGVETKLRSIDPYLFYMYQFRRYMFEPDCKLLITIGYSFSDDHINDIIIQALRQNQEISILNISPFESLNKEKTCKKIMKALNAKEELRTRIKPVDIGAKEFLEDKLSRDFLSEFLMHTSDENPF